MQDTNRSPEEYMFTFSSTRDAIEGERKLLAAGLGAGVMPLPAALGAGCGICLRIRPEDLEGALAAPGFRFRELYAVHGGDSGGREFSLWNP
jgi:hypothetical protein